MTHRILLLLASATVLVAATPAAGQDNRNHGEATHHGEMDHHGASDSQSGQYDGEWEGEWAGQDTWHGEWSGTYTDGDGQSVEAEYRGVWTGGRRGHRRHHGPRLAYSAEERAQWLADCRFLMAGSSGYYADDYGDGRDDGLIGGLLGAVIGGAAGNRIAEDNRVLGTVVGAGLGGLAGVAIGSAVDGDGDGEVTRDELWVARYCDAYLRRYELGAGAWGQVQPMMIVPVAYSTPRRRPRHHNCGTCERSEAIEENSTIESPAPRPAARRPQPAPAPAPESQSELAPIS